MGTAVGSDPQTSIYETVIDNPEIEEALEARAKAKASAKAVQKKAQDADTAAKTLLNTLDLGIDAPVRIGRFLIKVREVEARDVAFSTDKTTRIQIKTDDGGDE